jgi:hypothetical protein
MCSPCAPRLQVPRSASRVVPGAHRVVGPGTHRGSGPREVHTTLGSASKPSLKLCWSYLVPVRSVVYPAMTGPCPHFKPLDLLSRSLMFTFIHAQEDFILFDPCAPYAASSVPCLRFASTRRRLSRFAYTSIGGLSDMCTHGSPPTRVSEVQVKWTQPARSPTDLQVGPETLSTILVTLEDRKRPHPDSKRPVELVAQASPLDHGAVPPVGPRIAGSSM